MLPKRLVYISSRENSYKFYCLELSQSMFGEVGLLKTHGRLGTSGQQIFWRFRDEAEAVAFARQKLREKLSAGYVEASGADWNIPLASLLRQLQLNEDRSNQEDDDDPEMLEGQLDLFVKYERPPVLQVGGNVIEFDVTRGRAKPSPLASIALTDCLLDDRANSRIADFLYHADIQTLEQLNGVSDVRLAELTGLDPVRAAEFRRKVSLGARAFLSPGEIAEFKHSA